MVDLFDVWRARSGVLTHVTYTLVGILRDREPPSEPIGLPVR